MINNSSFLIVSTVRNVEKTLQNEINKISRALKNSKNMNFYMVESDSSDLTKYILDKNKIERKNLDYISLGQLETCIENRIERIRFCRNKYVEYIRKYYELYNWDYVLVLDLDGTCKNLTKNAINSCFKTDISWDACFANQLFGYYDLYALREQNWMPDDCFILLNNEKSKLDLDSLNNTSWLRRFLIYDKIRHKVIYSKMRRLPRKKSWVRVTSAFGGAGLYKTDVFLTSNYDQNENSTLKICEHVDLHKNALKNGFTNFYINPKFINLYINLHILNRLKIIRFLRELIKYIKTGGGGGI